MPEQKSLLLEPMLCKWKIDWLLVGPSVLLAISLARYRVPVANALRAGAGTGFRRFLVTPVLLWMYRVSCIVHFSILGHPIVRDPARLRKRFFPALWATHIRAIVN